MKGAMGTVAPREEVKSDFLHEVLPQPPRLLGALARVLVSRFALPEQQITDCVQSVAR